MNVSMSATEVINPGRLPRKAFFEDGLEVIQHLSAMGSARLNSLVSVINCVFSFCNDEGLD